ncbi:AAA family ATPase [Oceanobacillus oncorhynchi]|uniref:AAA family ATPase n=1 Tax=Oceanobacillus oncorhynchi TaxID=545501 RepID=UPI0034D5F1A2
MKGFKINKLVLTGEYVDSKSISFKKGLNLLVGPSNTGKTYVFQCIDFVLGKSKLPKKITLSKGYKYAHLEIEEYSSGETSTISRSLIDSKYQYYPSAPFENIDDTVPIPLDSKLSKNKNISSLILNLCGFNQPIEIKKSQTNDKVNFSFRYFAPFILIKEEVMISERSPIYTGSFTERTLRLNIFKFLLTNKDDSSLVKIEKKEIWSAKKNANVELLEKLLMDENEKLSTLEQNKDKFSKVYFSKEDENQLESIQMEISTLNNEISKNEVLKNKIQSDINYNENLKYKFDLLREQYLSDIERLQFIDEGSFLLNQLSVTKCPHCGEDISENKQHEHGDIDMNHVNEACDYEIEKIRINLSELEKSTFTVNSIIDSLQEDLTKAIKAIEECKYRLQEVLNPKLAALNETWNNRLEYEVIVSDIEYVNHQIGYLKELISETSSKKQQSPNKSSDEEIINALNEDTFPTLLETNLKECLFYEYESLPIKFYKNSDQELDFLINGEERETFGKGYRSIIASIFHITLLMYCQVKGLPHSNLLILDSPVNAFRDLEVNEKLPKSVQNKFFNFIAENFSSEQMIVIENDSVSKDLEKNVNLIEFTHDNNRGRFGFF